MKLSHIGLKAPAETSFDLLKGLRHRVLSIKARWSAHNVTRFSTTASASAKSPAWLGHASYSTRSRSIHRPKANPPESNVLKSQSNDSLVELTPLLHQLANSLQSETNSSLADAQHQNLLRSVTSKLQGLLHGQDRSVEVSATIEGNENKEYGSRDGISPRYTPSSSLNDSIDKGTSIRYHPTKVPSLSLPQSTSDIVTRPDPYPRHQNQSKKPQPNNLFKKVVSGESVVPVRYFLSEDLPAPQKSKESHKSAGWGPQLVNIVNQKYRFPGQTIPIRQLLSRTERRGLLQLATNLVEVLSYAASEKQTESQEQNHSEFETLRSDDEGQASANVFPTTTNGRLSNLSILAAYVDLQLRKVFLTQQDYDTLLLKLFNNQTMRYLKKVNYSIEDIVAWAWILSAQSNYDATLRLLSWTNRPMPASRVPGSIFRILLERNITDPKVVQLLTVHLWHRLTNRIDSAWETLYRKLPQESTSSYQDLMRQENSCTANYQRLETNGSSKRLSSFGLRLIKMAAFSTPALLPSIATMLCEHLKASQSSDSTREDRLSFESSVHITEQYNQILMKLATSTTPEPYNSVPYQEQAQFIVIRRMNEYKPPLVLGKTTYKAVISVQLRHRKTLKERLWAELKSRGWPPYREDKIGLDAKKKDEVYGVSRAQQAITNFKEAGYAATMWEDSASVLSGWDVNRSPTIQTRKVFRPDLAVDPEDQYPSTELSRLWESRVLSTRTVQEAWAAFLNYMEEDIPRTPGVFLVIFKKIAFERDRRQNTISMQNAVSSKVLAGDMPEVFPSSPNPRDVVYTPSPPPSYDDFYQRYRAQFPIIDTRTLCFLLSNAESLEQGYSYIQASSLTAQHKDILLLHQKLRKGEIYSFPSGVLTAYIRMLSRHPSDSLPNNHHVSALTQAIHLVCSLRPVFRGPWLFLLQALGLELRKTRRKVLWHRNWSIVTEVVEKMESAGVSHDSDTFYSICSIFSHLLQSASQELGDDRCSPRTAMAVPSSDLLVRTAQLLKRIFRNLVSLDMDSISRRYKHRSFLPIDSPDLAPLKASKQSKMSALLPQLLYVPSPAAIHHFVRLLGSIGDRKAVLDLVKWMAFFDPELRVKVTGLANGTRHFRWILIAVRIIMETTSRPFASSIGLSEITNSRSEHAIEVRSTVEKMESWGGWPDDDEVAEYMARGNMNIEESS